MVKIILEDWQVKNLREYFGHNDKTQTSHWAFEVFNKAYKEQCNIPNVVLQSEQLACDCDRQPLRYNELGTCKYCGKQKPSEG